MLRNKNFFYGWVIVAAGFLLQGLGSGTTQYLVGIFLIPFIAEFEATRASTLLATSGLFTGAGSLMGPIVGFLMRFYSLRSLLCFATFWMSLGFIGLSLAVDLWHVALVYSIFFALGACLITLGTNALAANWFDSRRGRALGLMTAGTSAFAFILPIIVTFWNIKFGWRNSCLLLAGMFFFVSPIIFGLVVDDPVQYKSTSNKKELNREFSTNLDRNIGKQLSFSAIWIAPKFWLIALTIGVGLGVAVAIATNIVPIAIDAGYSAARAAYLVSILAVCGFLGKIMFGYILDYISQIRMVEIPLLCLAIACVLLSLSNGYLVYVGASIMTGLSIGALTPAWSMMIAQTFGRQSFAFVMGATIPIVSLILTISVPLVGLVYDLTDTYIIAWWIYLAMLGLAWGCNVVFLRNLFVKLI